MNRAWEVNNHSKVGVFPQQEVACVALELISHKKQTWQQGIAFPLGIYIHGGQSACLLIYK